jgi:hypothetical protein
VLFTPSQLFSASSYRRYREGNAADKFSRNTNGTTNYQNRIHKIGAKLTLQPDATALNPTTPNLQLNYLDTILLTGPDGTPTTGLDADVVGPYLPFPGFPDVPAATFTGDGFGGPGPGGHRITVDSEGLGLGIDGSFWVSDEYGPYIYQFSSTGEMIQAIRPPDAYIPRRNGTESFSADSPPIFNPNEIIIPANVDSGRSNNQGFEGLTLSSDGKKLFALLQSALGQEGGPNNPNRKQARLIEYDISCSPPVYTNEYVVTLPLISNGSKVAAQSEIHYVSDTQFLVLARDSGAGHGQKSSASQYRHADVFDISSATDIKSVKFDSTNGSIASPQGDLVAGVTAAQYCSFLDYNVNSELNKFGVHNGGAQDQFLLNEKWESLALLPIGGRRRRGGRSTEYLLFSFSDNDLITQNGHLNFGQFAYSDASGFNLDNQALVFHVTLPD